VTQSSIRKLTSLLIYLSVGYLLYYLFKIDLVDIPRVSNWSLLIVSVIFLSLGFLAQCIVWWKTLEYYSVRCSVGTAVRSIGKTIFAKYLPGKIWQIGGRAAYIHAAYGGEIKQLVKTSVYVQLLSIFTSVVVLMFCIVASPIPFTTILESFNYIVGIDFVRYLVLGATILASIFLKTQYKKYDLLSRSGMLSLYATPWLIWGIGFHFLLLSLGLRIPIVGSMSVFVAASTVGIVISVSPGGLGVREGFMVWALVVLDLGLDVSEANGIAVAARIWFVFGELFIFITALFIGRNSSTV